VEKLLEITARRLERCLLDVQAGRVGVGTIAELESVLHTLKFIQQKREGVPSQCLPSTRDIL
jgi:hypothetical protein